jgi:hypothetical protein
VATEAPAAASLEEQVAFLRQVIDVNPCLIFTKDRSGRFTLANRTVAAMYGTTVDELLGKTDADFNPKAEEVEAFQRADLEVMDTRREKRIAEEPVSDAQGNLRWFETIKRPLVGPDGIANQVLGTAIDVTERKQLAETHQRAEEKFRSVLEFAPDAMVITNERGEIVLVNAQAEQLFGYPRRELLGRPFELLLPERERSARAALHRSYMAAPTRRPMGQGIEVHALRKGGNEVPVEVSLAPLMTEEGLLILSAIRDLTERIHAQERLREQAALLDKARDAIFVFDLAGRVRYWNQGAERLYGWSSEETLGRDALGLLCAAEGTECAANHGAVLEKGEWVGEARRVSKGGRQLLIEASWTLVRGADGAPDSVLARETDITEKKALERQFLRAQRMESLGTIAGGIAHDLNNVLAPILLSMDLLGRRITDAPGRRILEGIGAAARRGADMVRQILTFARGVDGERLALQPARVLGEVEKLLAETFPKEIDVRVNVAPDLWSVVGDATQLHQVLLNLCVNARDVMADGGVLRLGADNAMLDEHYARMHLEAKAGPYVVLSVEDTGLGIPPAILDRIFEPFFTTKEVGKGTGLGLATSVAIVRSHGGFVTVYSEMRKGTTFKVYLPATPGAAEAVAHPEPSTLARANGEKILVVDDEPVICQVAQETLEGHGYQVLTAADGAEALALYVQTGDVTAVVTDMRMPVMDGTAMIRALEKLNPGVRIVATSGLADGPVSLRAADATMRAFLRKPYTAHDLLSVLHQMIHGHAG